MRAPAHRNSQSSDERFRRARRESEIGSGPASLRAAAEAIRSGAPLYVPNRTLDPYPNMRIVGFFFHDYSRPFLDVYLTGNRIAHFDKRVGPRSRTRGGKLRPIDKDLPRELTWIDEGSQWTISTGGHWRGAEQPPFTLHGMHWPPPDYWWALPQVQELVARFASDYALQLGPDRPQPNPRGDEAMRRAQRGEGGDPKIEAWRRGLAVPPDQQGNSIGHYWSYWAGWLSPDGLETLARSRHNQALSRRGLAQYAWTIQIAQQIANTLDWRPVATIPAPNAPVADWWLSPEVQQEVQRAYTLPRSNPRGDEAMRRSQRGEGGDPKIEAWRRGLAVPPDSYYPSTYGTVYWHLSDPSLRDIEDCYVEARQWHGLNSLEYSIRAVDNNAGWFNELRVSTPFGSDWKSPEVQEAVAAAYRMLVDFVRERLAEPPLMEERAEENPRGDEAMRRAQRGESPGRDPKLEAWRRGHTVPPDVVRELTHNWPATTQAYWRLPNAEEEPPDNWATSLSQLTQKVQGHAPAYAWPHAVSVVTHIYWDSRESGATSRAYDIYFGQGNSRRITTFDFGNPRWEDPELQQLVQEAYAKAMAESYGYNL